VVFDKGSVFEKSNDVRVESQADCKPDASASGPMQHVTRWASRFVERTVRKRAGGEEAGESAARGGGPNASIGRVPRMWTEEIP